MPDFYDVPVRWRDGEEAVGRGVGNNAAWICKCGEVLLGPHEDRYQIGPCPNSECGRNYRIRRGEKPNFVSLVEEA